MSDYDIGLRLQRWQDRATKAPRFIDNDHAYIHDGRAFTVSLNATDGAADVQYVLHTDDNLYVHFRPAWIAIDEGEAIVSIYEDTTSTGGAGWTASTGVYNRNRVSSATAQSVLYTASTSAGGTLINQFAIFGGSGPGNTSIGATKSEPIEWVLQRGTQYRIVVGTTEQFYAQLFWYEEE